MSEHPHRSYGPVIVAVLAAGVVWGSGVFGPYGWFTDELYFLACAKRPAFGYVDHPPLATWLLTALRVVFRDQLALIRLVPATAYAIAIVQTAQLARMLGGARFAQTLAAVLFATAPAVIVIAGFYSMNPFELLLLIALARITIALVDGAAPPRAWIGFGVVTGIAILNKHSSLFPAGLFAAAIVASPARSHFRTRWPYLGAAIAFAIAVPNLVWLVEHDWVTLEFYRVSVPLKNIPQTPIEALVGQAMFVGPITFAITVLGAWRLARQPGRRGLALAFIVALIAMMVSGISRADRILAMYPIVMAAGAVTLERAGTLARAGVVIIFAIGTVVPLPLILPILPPPLVIRYSQAIAVTPQLEVAKRGAMPQWLGDKLGWPEVVAAADAAYRTLSPADRAEAVVFGATYGIAGALELAHVPAPVISTHDAFWLWGPRPGAVVIAVGYDEAYWTALYADVRRVGTVRCTGCLVDGTPVFVARGPAPGLAARWTELGRFE